MKQRSGSLIFFSGGSKRDNKELCQKAAALLFRERKPLRVTFIPVESEYSRGDYEFVKKKLQFLGDVKVRFQAIDRKRLTAKDKQRLFACDAIYMGGGNTFYFLKHLKRQNLLKGLKRFAQEGGILFGYSAGGIVMTPKIVTAYIPSLDADENLVGLTSLESLRLVDFEFSPHYISARSVKKELKDYSRYLKRPIYACEDGAGIIVKSGKVIRVVGNVVRFFRGRMRKISKSRKI